MSERVEIPAVGYSIVLTAKSLDILREAVESTTVKGKTGEALAEALLAVAAGGISQVQRCKDGKLNDGANGDPAVQEFNASGGLIRAARYKDGQLVKTLDAAEMAAYQEAVGTARRSGLPLSVLTLTFL